MPKLGLEWDFGEDKMLYASYTEGLRPGGVNRAKGRAAWSRTLFPQLWERAHHNLPPARITTRLRHRLGRWRTYCALKTNNQFFDPYELGP